MKTEKRTKKSFWKNVRAVSPVIGVILMVAVTVVMAAIIMSWSSGITAPETPKQCGISINRVDADYLRATITSIVPVGTEINSITYSNETIINSVVFNATGSDPVGTFKAAAVGAANTSIPVKKSEYVVFIVNWADGTTDILYDAKI